jgi:integrase
MADPKGEVRPAEMNAQQLKSWAAANAGKRAETAVGGVPGLVARLGQSGRLSFSLLYRNRESGKQTKMTIGVVSLSDARKRAGDILAQARVGIDPWEERKAARMAAEAERKRKDRTIAVLAEAWLTSEEAKRWKPRTRYEGERLVRKHVIGTFGSWDAGSLTRRELRSALEGIAKTAPSEARHAFGMFRAFYAWLRQDRQEDRWGVFINPTEGLKAPGGKPKKRSRVYTDAEIAAILAAAGNTNAADLVTLLFHTATRDSETRGMKWADIDFGRALWTIPAEESKNGKPRLVPLSAGALDILRRRPRFGKFVFGNAATRSGHDDRPNHKVLKSIAIAAGLLRNEGTKHKPVWAGEALHLHDIRRTVSDRIKLAYDQTLMHAALGHAEAALTEIYGPTPRIAKLAEVMEWWASELVRITTHRTQERRA